MLANLWVIGIGTAIIAGLFVVLVSYFVFGIGKPKPTSVPIQSVRNNFITPEEIYKYLKSLPPLQRDTAAKNYTGITVSWKVTLSRANQQRDGKLRLFMFIEGKHDMVVCYVDPEQYPLLKVIKTDQLFTVEGEIEEVGTSYIHLNNCRLFL